MKTQNEQFEKNIADLVKTAGQSQIPPESFTENLIDQALNKLRTDPPRRQKESTIMKSIIKIAACVIIATGILSLIIVTSLKSSRKNTNQPFANNESIENTESIAAAKTEETLAPIPLELPKAMFVGTPANLMGIKNLEKPTNKSRPPFYAPVGTENVALNKPVTSSEEYPISGELEMIVDGDKEASDGSVVELGVFDQWVQIDLEQQHNIYAIVLWHYHKNACVYFDIVAQVSDDPEFITNVTTVFNNDTDNSLGFGIGDDKHYIESAEGKLIDTRGIKARYVRLYSQGNNQSDYSHYIEVEVYGQPAKAEQTLAAIPLELPKPLFISTPLDTSGVKNLEKFTGKPRPLFYAPVGTRNVALNKPVISSEMDPIMGRLEMIVDGNKEAPDRNILELGAFDQWVQIDLQQEHSIYAIVFWHYHSRPRVYYDVVVQTSNDPEFITDVTTLFNNDIDNSLNFGPGKDKHYFETHEGKLVDARGIKARYVRLYSQGNIQNDYNHYIEVDVYGKPAG